MRWWSKCHNKQDGNRNFILTVCIRFAICHILATMSDSSIAENGKEFSEMQKVTLLLHMFRAFDPYKLDRIWAIMFDNLRSILKNRGGNDYKLEHTGKRKRQKDAGTAVDEDYSATSVAVRLVRG